MSFVLERLRMDTRRRAVVVRDVQRLTPAYHRVVFEGEELEGFASPGADDHIKIFWGEESREFTPAEVGEGRLAVDFVLHGAGLASTWAQRARPGDGVVIGGPRGSLLVRGEPDWWLLAGDLTALPAIRRRAAEALPGTPVDVIVLADSPDDVQPVESPGDLRVRWVHPAAGAPSGDVTPLIDVLDALPPRAGHGFAFIAAEQSIVKPARELLDARGVPLEHSVVKGYWKRGSEAGH